MDPLSDVLRVAHLTGSVFLHADVFRTGVNSRVPHAGALHAGAPACVLPFIIYRYVWALTHRFTRRIAMPPMQDLAGCGIRYCVLVCRFVLAATEAIARFGTCSMIRLMVWAH